jgi:hypothetical protein
LTPLAELQESVYLTGWEDAFEKVVHICFRVFYRVFKADGLSAGFIPVSAFGRRYLQKTWLQILVSNFRFHKRSLIMVRTFLAVVVFAAVAFSATTSGDASIDTPGGAVSIQLPPATIITNSDADPWTTAYSSPVMHPERNEGSSVWPEYDWGTDIIVSPGRVGSGQDFDRDPVTGDLYAIYDTNHATQDSAIVFRSQDNGVTWTFWRTSLSSVGEVNNPHIRVVRDTSGQSWVCMFFLVGKTLRMRYMTPDQTSSGWTTVTSQDVIYYDVDGEADTSAWLYATYVPDASGNDIWATRCSMSAKTWVNDTQLFVNPGMTPYPSIATSNGGTLAVAFLDDRVTANKNIRIKRSANYGLSWMSSAQVGTNSGAFDLSWISIAFNYVSSGVGWIFVTYEGTSTGDNLGYHYTTNGGTSWTYGSVLAGNGDENMPNIRSRKVTGAATLAFNSDPGDSTMFCWASVSSPNSFSAPTRINDFNATGYWPATAGWASNMSAVLYVNWNSNYRLLFDWYGNTAVSEEESTSLNGTVQMTSSPNPFTTMANISFNVVGTEPVSVSIYNMSGRLVKTIVNNEDFSTGEHSVQWNGVDSRGAAVTPGVYFCRLNTGSTVLSTRLVMVP